jgi:transposase
MSAAKNTSQSDSNAMVNLIAEQESLIAQQNALIEAQVKRIAILEEIVRFEKLKKYGSSSEKAPDQHDMFNEAELVETANQLAETGEPALASEEPSRARTEKGRKPLPPDLPRIRIEHDINEADKTCSCGCQRVEIGEECSEQLDIIPAKVHVLVHARKKYACPRCEEGVQTARLPAQPIPKSNASAGLLAHIATQKYQDALPLYRQEAILARSGIEIPRNTLASWMIKAGELIQPLINLLSEQQLSYPILHCDETRVQVLKEPGKQPISKSYMWVRVGGPPTQPIRLFHYADSRRGGVVNALLAGYQGYLQTDDYAGYNTVAEKESIIQLGCWAHARRKFIDTQKANPKHKTGKADIAISYIARLYAIEKDIKDQPAEERLRVRQEKSIPLLKAIKEWMDKALSRTVPKGLLGKALNYLNKNWEKLTVYTQDGRLSIDNNPAENAIRPFVIGRKNWLFSATVEGAASSANLYSLIETAKANGLEPYGYLKKVFSELPKATDVEGVEALLPWNVKLKDGVY